MLKHGMFMHIHTSLSEFANFTEIYRDIVIYHLWILFIGDEKKNTLRLWMFIVLIKNIQA